MNTLIAAVVGAFVSTTVLITGVHAVQGDQKPVSSQKLYTYSSQ
ncbi:MAG TPA: hypothetical protein VNS81_03910 [Nocardioides sp.]|nr:hypothetical protein [Nocardioides sp.]